MCRFILCNYSQVKCKGLGLGPGALAHFSHVFMDSSWEIGQAKRKFTAPRTSPKKGVAVICLRVVEVNSQ